MYFCLSSSQEISLDTKLQYSRDSLEYGLGQALDQLNKNPVSTSVANKFINLFNTSRLNEFCMV